MPPKSFQLLNDVEPTLHRVSFEIRYGRSPRFYSEFGGLLEIFENDHPEWLVNHEGVRTNQFKLISTADSTEVSLSDVSVNITLAGRNDRRGHDRDDLISFARTCASVEDIYSEKIKPKEMLRVGYREWWWFYFEGEDEANEWLLSLGLFSPTDTLVDLYGSKPEKSSFVGVFNCEAHYIRLAMNVIEFAPQIELEENINTVKTHLLSTNQKNSLIEQQRRAASRIRMGKTFAAVLDFDAYQEFPSNVSVSVLIQDFNRKLLPDIQNAFKVQE